VDMESCSQTPGTVLLYNTLFSLYWNWICKLYVGFYSCFFVSSHNQSQRQCQLLPSLGISQQFTFHIVIFSSERLMQVLTFFSRAKYNFIQVYAHFVFATIKKKPKKWLQLIFFEYLLFKSVDDLHMIKGFFPFNQVPITNNHHYLTNIV
jgi:hypothetical protein